jgi:hypothetical protein
MFTVYQCLWTYEQFTSLRPWRRTSGERSKPPCKSVWTRRNLHDKSFPTSIFIFLFLSRSCAWYFQRCFNGLLLLYSVGYWQNFFSFTCALTSGGIEANQDSSILPFSVGVCIDRVVKLQEKCIYTWWCSGCGWQMTWQPCWMRVFIKASRYLHLECCYSL